MGHLLGLARRVIACGLAAAVAGCSSDRNVAFDRLSAISASATTAESGYIRQAAEADCRADLLKRVYDSATTGGVLDVAMPCAPFADEKLLKQYDVLLKGITAYTAALQAEQAAGSTTSLDDASKALATQFGAAAKSGGVLANLGPGNAVTTAADSIVSWIFGDVTYRNAREAAAAQKANLARIVAALKGVNADIASHMTTVRNGRIADANVLKFKVPRSDPAQTVIVENQLLEVEGLVPHSANWIGPGDFEIINVQLDALVRCNDAIAGAGKHPSVACAAVPALSQTAPAKAK